ncbi:MAG: hypothetical protein V3W31_07925 [Thermodesulfobacteriota bacterium]
MQKYIDAQTGGSSIYDEYLSTIEHRDSSGSGPVSALDFEEQLNIERIYLENRNAMQEEFDDLRIQRVADSSLAESEIERNSAELKIRYAAKERDFKLKANQATFASAVGFMQNIYAATGSSNKKLFNLMKAFNVAQALMDAYTAFNITLRSLPYPANIAAAAMVLAQGLARVRQIKATKPGGGAGGGGGGGVPTLASGGTGMPEALGDNQPLRTQNITVSIYNPLSQQNWAEIVENDIIPQINDAVENRDINLTVKTVEA